MTYRVGPDDYILKPRGIRVQDNNSDTSLTGTVDTSLFNSDSPCDEKTNPNEGNVVYLYEGNGLDQNDLSDVFDPDASIDDVPADAIEPYAAETVSEEGDYSFGFIPAGDYTLVFSCNALDDDPENYDGLELPVPDDQLIELSLSAGVSVLCNLPIDENGCAQ